LLARIAATNGIPPTIGMYRFDEEAVAQGNAAIITAVQDGLEIVAVDEVGPLEFQGKGWTQALQLALVEATLAQQLIIVVRFSLVDRLSERFPSPKWALASRISPPWPALPPP
jgi:nucleoside-triphosphatase THEP1